MKKITFSYPFNEPFISYDNFWNCFSELETISIMKIKNKTIINNIFCEAKLYYKIGVFSKEWRHDSTFSFTPTNKQYVFQIGEHKNIFGNFISCDITHFLWDIGLKIPSNFSNNKIVHLSQVSYDPYNDCLPHLWNMIQGLRNYDEENLKSMNMKRFWDTEKMNWIGPWSIGHLASLKEFEEYHQIPFLKCTPKRDGSKGKNKVIFSDGNFAASMGYPSMSGSQMGKYFGFPPSKKELSPYVMDFWTYDGNLLIDNWVQIDMLQLWMNISPKFKSYMKSIFSREENYA